MISVFSWIPSNRDFFSPSSLSLFFFISPPSQNVVLFTMFDCSCKSVIIYVKGSWFKLSITAAEVILLGFQHYLVMLGTTVSLSTIIVPLMGGGNVRTFSQKAFQFSQNISPSFSLQSNSFLIYIGGEGWNDKHFVVCCGYQYFITNLVWNPFACGDWWIVYLHHSGYLGSFVTKI